MPTSLPRMASILYANRFGSTTEEVVVIYVLKMNSCVILYQVEVIERNGFRQEEVQSDCLLADQILRTVRMPFVNFLVQAGRISASIWIGIICTFLTGGLILSDKSKK